MRIALVAALTLSSVSVASVAAARPSTVAQAKAKATVASITARRDKFRAAHDDLVKVAASLRAIAPASLPVGDRKLLEQLIGDVDGLVSTSASTDKKMSDVLKTAPTQTQLDQMLAFADERADIMLQAAMQAEGRAYKAVSNIMKTKHDTVKNSISNIR